MWGGLGGSEGKLRPLIFLYSSVISANATTGVRVAGRPGSDARAGSENQRAMQEARPIVL
jgi:hypothetical protein